MLKKINFKLIYILVNIINLSALFSSEAITISNIQDIEKYLALSPDEIQVHKDIETDNSGPKSPLIINLYFDKNGHTIKSIFPQYPNKGPLKIDSFSFKEVNNGKGKWRTANADGFQNIFEDAIKFEGFLDFFEYKDNKIFLNLVRLKNLFKRNVEESINTFNLKSEGSLMLDGSFYIKINFDQNTMPAKKKIKETEKIILIVPGYAFEFSYDESKSNLFLRKRSKIEDFKLIDKNDTEINQDYEVENVSNLDGDLILTEFEPKNKIMIKNVAFGTNIINPIQTPVKGKDIDYSICNLAGFKALTSKKNLMIKNSKKPLKTPSEIDTFISEMVKVSPTKEKESAKDGEEFTINDTMINDTMITDTTSTTGAPAEKPTTGSTTGTSTAGTPATGTSTTGTPATGTPATGTSTTGTSTTGTSTTGTSTTGTSTADTVLAEDLKALEGKIKTTEESIKKITNDLSLSKNKEDTDKILNQKKALQATLNALLVESKNKIKENQEKDLIIQQELDKTKQNITVEAKQPENKESFFKKINKLSWGKKLGYSAVALTPIILLWVGMNARKKSLALNLVN